MLDLGPHASFIIAAYGVTGLAVAVLVFVTLADDRAQRRKLAALERQGIRRRSAPRPETAAANTPAPKTTPSMTAPPAGENTGPAAKQESATRKPAAKRKTARKKTPPKSPNARKPRS
jgi:heme exporter protein D